MCIHGQRFEKKYFSVFDFPFPSPPSPQFNVGLWSQRLRKDVSSDLSAYAPTLKLGEGGRGAMAACFPIFVILIQLEDGCYRKVDASRRTSLLKFRFS